MSSRGILFTSAARADVAVRTRGSVRNDGADSGSAAAAQPGFNLTAAVHLRAPVLFATAGTLAMAIGMLVYLTARPVGHAALLPAAVVVGAAPLFGTSLSATFAATPGPLLGLLSGWLPSFVHPFAFSLFTAAARPAGTSPAYGACAGWWAVNVAFEVAQQPAVAGAVTQAVEAVIGRTGLTRPLTNFLLRGTFDVGDLIAATTGALAAAGVLALVHRWETLHAHG